MKVPGLLTINPQQTELLEEMANLIGTCFLEEQWYVIWLKALDEIGVDRARKELIIQRIIREHSYALAPFGCCFALEDKTGAASAYLRSEFPDLDLAQIEENAFNCAWEMFTDQEKHLLDTRMGKLSTTSDICWPHKVAKSEDDFIYIISLGVDTSKRGSGAFGRLFRPFLELSDQRGIDVYLDCCTERLEQIYAHYGFEVVERKTNSEFDLIERCMVRHAQCN